MSFTDLPTDVSLALIKMGEILKSNLNFHKLVEQCAAEAVARGMRGDDRRTRDHEIHKVIDETTDELCDIMDLTNDEMSNIKERKDGYKKHDLTSPKNDENMETLV